MPKKQGRKISRQEALVPAPGASHGGGNTDEGGSPSSTTSLRASLQASLVQATLEDDGDGHTASGGRERVLSLSPTSDTEPAGTRAEGVGGARHNPEPEPEPGPEPEPEPEPEPQPKRQPEPEPEPEPRQRPLGTPLPNCNTVLSRRYGMNALFF